MGAYKFQRLEKSMRELMRDSIRMEAVLGPVFVIASFIVRSNIILMTLAGSYLMMSLRGASPAVS
jgi:ATP-binding cassette subfamily B protein